MVIIMKMKKIAKIKGGQDGAIYGEYFFRLDDNGVCFVYKINDLKNSHCEACDTFYTFTLDKVDTIVPHSNSVMFGNEFFSLMGWVVSLLFVYLIRI